MEYFAALFFFRGGGGYTHILIDKEAVHWEFSMKNPCLCYLQR